MYEEISTGVQDATREGSHCHLTSEEIRVLRNRQASKRYNDRRKARLQELGERNDPLRTSNIALSASLVELDHLRAQNTELFIIQWLQGWSL
jgi:hypothetical protein